MFRHVISCLFFACLLSACSPVADNKPVESAVTENHTASTVVAPTCQLTMGVDPYEPYQYADADGQIRGLDIELTLAMAELAQCQLIYTQNHWSALIRDLKNGKIDLLAGATRTTERDQFALFTDSYRTENFVLLIRSGEAEKWVGRDLRELLLKKKMRLGITDGYIYGEELNNLYDNSNAKKLFSPASMTEVHFANLIDMNIDGILEDPFVAAAVLRHKNLSSVVTQQGISLSAGHVHLMFSKQLHDEQRIARFNMALSTLKTSGRYQQIIDRYLKN